MWQAIWQLSARRTLAWFLPAFFLLVGYVLFATCPLGPDLLPAAFGALMGWALAYRLFLDPPGVSPFIFSRPFSRTRLFFYRWLIGLLLQAFAIAVIFLVLAIGLRQVIQVEMFQSTYYPMIRPIELSVLWPIAIASLLVYQVTCFVLLRSRLYGRRHGSKVRRLGNAAFLAIAGLLTLLFLITSIRMQGEGIGMLPSLSPLWTGVLFGYGALLVATTTLAGWCCSRHFEVES
jgi:hypothetical protein